MTIDLKAPGTRMFPASPEFGRLSKLLCDAFGIDHKQVHCLRLTMDWQEGAFIEVTKGTTNGTVRAALDSADK